MLLDWILIKKEKKKKISAPKRVRKKHRAKTLSFVVSAYQNYVTITRAYDMRHLAQVNEATKLSATEQEIK